LSGKKGPVQHVLKNGLIPVVNNSWASIRIFAGRRRNYRKDFHWRACNVAIDEGIINGYPIGTGLHFDDFATYILEYFNGYCFRSWIPGIKVS